MRRIQQAQLDYIFYYIFTTKLSQSSKMNSDKSQIEPIKLGRREYFERFFLGYSNQKLFEKLSTKPPMRLRVMEEILGHKTTIILLMVT